MSAEIPQKTWAEIDSQILRRNIRLLKQAIGPGREIVLVVKSDAYGHGARAVANVASEEGVSHFAVAAVAEGAALRQADIQGEIILLHPPFDFEIETALEAHLSPTISDLATAQLLNDQATRDKAGVHVEINTGVNRLGLDWQNAIDTILKIAALPRIQIRGIFTHFRASDGIDSVSIKTQFERFQQVLSAAEKAGINVGLRHAASSMVAARFPECHLDAIRPGIIAYTGLSGLAAKDQGVAALPMLSGMDSVMSVRTRVLHTRSVPAGEWIHYGEAYRAPRQMTVAVLAIGYGLGYPRHLTNNADVLIHGKRVPVVGTVGMDMTIVATDAVGPVSVGEVATILGRDGQERITAAEIAERIGTIPYEILCRLGNSLPRVVRGANEAQTHANLAAPSDTHE